MNRAEQAEKTTKALYGGASALGVTDPEFAAIKERLIYGEVYAEESSAPDCASWSFWSWRRRIRR